jgi:hypothetical protein
MNLAQAIDAGLARRVGAVVLDTGVLLVLFAALNLLLFKLGVLDALSDDGAPRLSGLWLRPGVIQCALLLVCIGVLGCWRWLGGTPGASLSGIVVVRARDGARAGMARLLVRMMVAYGMAGTGLLWSLGGRPALHDRVSGTRVVVEDEGLEFISSMDGATS